MTRTIYQETRTRTRWTFAQWAVLVICAAHVLIAIAGFIAEPSFETGHHAPTAKVLGMDYNGWHALAGLALFTPGLFLCRRNSWSVLYLLAAAVAGTVPGIWALASPHVMWVMHMPDHVTDAVIHLVTAAILVVIAVVQIRRDGGWAGTMSDLRRPPEQAARSHSPAA